MSIIVGVANIFLTIIYLIYSIICSKNKKSVPIYFNLDNYEIIDKKTFYLYNLLFSLLSCTLSITIGILISLESIEIYFIILVPLLLHSVNFIFKMICISKKIISKI